MKIKVAIVSPPFGETGGPEVITGNLANALNKRGIDVTLFAPADFRTNIKKVVTLDKSIWKMKNLKDQTKLMLRNYIIAGQTKVLTEKGYDIIHLHSQKYAYSIGLHSGTQCLLTLHSRISKQDYTQIKSANIFTAFISKSQKGSYKSDATIWNGVPVDKIKWSENKGNYLIAIGRIAEQKGIDTSIKIAQKAKKKLIIIGRVGNSEDRQKYFNQKVRPFINGKNIILIENVAHEKFLTYLMNAEALLFPIRRREVFPTAVIEALACGTPVIGTKIDPLPEQLKDKKTALLSNDISKLAKAAKNTEQFDRGKCREYAEKYFSDSRMADEYIRLYQKILKK